MPRRCLPDRRLTGLIRFQHQLIHRDQALAMGLTPAAIGYKLRTGEWRIVLPNVYLVQVAGEMSRQHMLTAASLFVGPAGAIDDLDALWFHGGRAARPDDVAVRAVVPQNSPARSRGFLIVRRTDAPISGRECGVIRFLAAAPAAIAATRRMPRERAVLAILSDTLQRNLTTYDDRVRAHIQGPPRNARRTDTVLETLATGVRSVGEATLMKLASASLILPRLEYNLWVALPAGQIMCLDAVALSSAAVHETNGRVGHQRLDLFEDMQQRHDLLTVTGFTALHNSPRRLETRGRQVVSELEQVHLMYGRGMPPGVRILTRDEVEAFLISRGLLAIPAG